MQTLTRGSNDKVNKDKNSTNILVQSSSDQTSDVTIFLSELLPRIIAFKVSYVILNLDPLSPLLAIGPAMPMNIVVYSSTFASISNNNYSYVNGMRRNAIATFPIHLGDLTTIGGRTTLKLQIDSLPWSKITTPTNINRIDFSLGFCPTVPFIFGPTDRWSIAINLKNEADSP